MLCYRYNGLCDTMPSNWIFWLVFNLFVLAMLALDLGVFQREKHVVELREAISWTLVWITLAACFAVLLYFFGHTMAGHARPNSVLSLEFVTGYLIELFAKLGDLRFHRVGVAGKFG